MPVFNAEKYISKAIESILSQSYMHFELIIVNDGSSDNSWAVISKYIQKDKRIRAIHLKKNQGVAIASNIAISKSKGKYIARMDSDDISMQNRLEKQVCFLEQNPEIGILGGKLQYMDESEHLLGISPIEESDLSIRWHLLFHSPFNNVSTMFRRDLIETSENLYEKTALYGEDYKLWGKFLLTTKGKNLSDILVYCRLHSSSLTHATKNILERRVLYSSQIINQHYPGFLSISKLEELQRSIKGTSVLDKYKRAKYISRYFQLWDAFYEKHRQKEDVENLKKEVFGYAAFLILYPCCQKNSWKALRQLTKKERYWFLYLLKIFTKLLRKRWATLSWQINATGEREG